MMEAKSQYQIVVDEYIKRGQDPRGGRRPEEDGGHRPRRPQDPQQAGRPLHARGQRRAGGGRAHRHRRGAEQEGPPGGGPAGPGEGPQDRPASSRAARWSWRASTSSRRTTTRPSQYLEEAVQQAPQRHRRSWRAWARPTWARRKIEEAEAIFKRLLELEPRGRGEPRPDGPRLPAAGPVRPGLRASSLPAVDRLVARREGDKAAALLQQIAQKNPAHVKSLPKLVEIYRAVPEGERGSPATLLAAHRGATSTQGRARARRRRVLEDLVAREPAEPAAPDASSSSCAAGWAAAPAPPRAPAPAARARRAGPRLEEEFDLEDRRARAREPAPAPPRRPARRGPPRAARGAGRARARPASRPAGPLTDEDREFIEEHLAEGRCSASTGWWTRRPTSSRPWSRASPTTWTRGRSCATSTRRRASRRAAEQCLALAEIFRLRGDEAHGRRARRRRPRRAARPPPAPPARPRRARRPSAPPLQLEEEEIAARGRERRALVRRGRGGGDPARRWTKRPCRSPSRRSRRSLEARRRTSRRST